MFILRRRRQGDTDFEALWLGVLAVTGVAAIVWLTLGLPTPTCVLHELTGLPCLTCGGTRCVRSALAGHLVAAAGWNPLVFAGLAAACVFWVYAAVVVIGNLPRLRLRPISENERRWLLGAVLVAGAANWVYLFFRL